MFTDFGRAKYPELAALDDALDAAKKALDDAVAAQFPVGARVLVRHARGEYFGTVTDSHGSRVFVRNDATGKVSGRYPLMDERGMVSVTLLD